MPHEKIKVALAGAYGRMGKAILECLHQNNTFVLTAATTSAASPSVGKIVAPNVMLSDCAESLFPPSDVVIDFSLPHALFAHLDLAVQYQKPMVLGTTGLGPQHHLHLQQASKHIPVLYAPNMSIGITLIKKIASTLTQALGPEYDVELSETHHRYKVDAPSGTSLMLGETIAQTRGVNLNQVAKFERYGTIGPRQKGEIGFSVQRGGHNLCEHTIKFLGDEESIEITHRGNSRAVYAKGALAAAAWIVDKKAGLYKMEDVLNLP